MRVFLVRHAHAVDEEHHLRDDQRYLTETGRRAIRQVGRALREEGVSFDAILTSPLVRAVQTAELLGERTDFTGIIEALPSLAPGVPPRLAAQELASRGVAVAVVGHEPGLSGLGAFLVGRPSFPSFRKAQIMCIEDGRPLWSLHPEALRFDRLLVS